MNVTLLQAAPPGFSQGMAGAWLKDEQQVAEEQALLRQQLQGSRLLPAGTPCRLPPPHSQAPVRSPGIASTPALLFASQHGQERPRCGACHSSTVLCGGCVRAGGAGGADTAAAAAAAAAAGAGPALPVSFQASHAAELRGIFDDVWMLGLDALQEQGPQDEEEEEEEQGEEGHEDEEDEGQVRAPPLSRDSGAASR